MVNSSAISYLLIPSLPELRIHPQDLTSALTDIHTMKNVFYCNTLYFCVNVRTTTIVTFM